MHGISTFGWNLTRYFTHPKRVRPDAACQNGNSHFLNCDLLVTDL